jgi:hypothetical protein
VSVVRSGDTNPAPNLVSAFCDVAGIAPCFATVVVPVCRGTTGCSGSRDISILSNMALDVAGEVQGYFIAPQATALDCTEVIGPTTQVLAGAYTYLGITACPAGYKVVSGGFSASSNVMMADNGLLGNGYYIYVRNFDSVAQGVTPRVNCCRIPGR